MRFRFLSVLPPFLPHSCLVPLALFPTGALGGDDSDATSYYCALTKEDVTDCANCYLDDETHATADADADECELNLKLREMVRHCTYTSSWF
jgi:hypothetical protein